eukprot:2138116-Rhodomonas_salina.2
MRGPVPSHAPALTILCTCSGTALRACYAESGSDGVCVCVRAGAGDEENVLMWLQQIRILQVPFRRREYT